MKHLLSLSFKYVTRQKLRSLLMFLCITLSVFVLNTFLMYSSSLLKSLQNDAVYQNGEWELEIGTLLDLCADGRSEKVSSAEEAADIITNHAAVDKAFCTVNSYDRFSMERDSEGNIGFFNIELGDGSRVRSQYIYQVKSSGDSSIINTAYYNKTTSSLAPDESYAPLWLENYGYAVGDTVTMTITPEWGVPDEDSDIVKGVRQYVKELNEASDQLYYMISDDPESSVDKSDLKGKKIKKRNMLSLIAEKYDISYLELTDSVKGEPFTVSFRIAGFIDDGVILQNSVTLFSGLNSTVDLSPLRDCPLSFTRVDNSNAYIRTNQNNSYDDDVYTLLNDLGFDGEDTYYTYLNNGIYLNEELLITTLRSTDGIAKAVPVIGAYLILLIIVWLLARFIIDNAFEISVQERSTQFAALRIMGASRGQLAALVFTEGLFYSVTAVPLGMALSTIACKYVFDSFRRVGVDIYEFYASPIVVIVSALLCLAGIFISSYTSAMWSARKLSPAEALNFGKPKSKRALKREARKKHKKSKVRLGSKRFIVRYTLKNIFRTKRRFLISSVALALGTLIFTLCLQLGLAVSGEIRSELLETERNDFYLFLNYGDKDEVISTLSKSENFRKIWYEYHGSAEITDPDDTQKLYSIWSGFNNEMQDEYRDMLFSVYAIDKNFFETKHTYLDYISEDIPIDERKAVSYADITGMSYEEFESKGGAIMVLPQKRYSDPSLDFGYGWTSSADLGYGSYFELDCGYSEPMKILGKLHADYATIIILPTKYAEKLINGSSKYMSVNLYATVTDMEHYEAAKAEINALADELELSRDDIFDDYRVGTGLTEFIKTIAFIVIVFMLSIWLCGIFSMMNTINTSVLNRSRELLMMRSVGMTKKQLFGTVLLESVLFSAFSTLIGTAVSIAGYQMIMRLIFDWKDPTSSIIALIASFAANVIIAALAAIPGVRSLSRSVKQNLM